MANQSENMEILKNPIQHSIENAKRRNSMKKVPVKIEDDQLDEMKKRNNDLLRNLADMQNYLKITQKEFEAQKKTAGMEILKGLLPFLDTLDAGASSEKDKNAFTSMRENLLSTLSKYGLMPIEAEGKKVDLKHHEVVGVVDGKEDNKIVHEIQKGYLLNNEVIRTSKVIVQKKGDKNE
ncbi:MAG: nucleotide exchange factor GrpE [Candidatus Thermoplasmatota archaeon]|nr:nucleotide exchange factor GrpE [Candidatus Thermoplasmatota archaeon]